MLRTTAILIMFALVGCYETSAPECTISCVVDDDCPGDLGCNGGACSTGMDCSGPPISECTANEFLSCTNATTARLCNATGDGAVTQDCGVPGCNTTAERCNACAADEVSCAGPTSLQRCMADGSGFMAVETCGLGCADGVVGVAAHCRTIAPEYLATICDMPAVDPEELYTVTGTLDTNLASTCTAVVPQPAGREICVIRSGRIRINVGVTMTFTGARVVALVADNEADVLGTIDVYATGLTDGPGGGSIVSGARATATLGGGGAGFKTVGANGGGPSGSGTGGAGGGTQNPTTLNSMIGGPRPIFSGGVTLVGGGGGGGGALMVISCKSTVTVSGIIDAGGGGGGGGRDQVGGPQISFTSAGGGGAGGHVLLQGAQVMVTTTAQTYANGGGGGGGTTTDDMIGGVGQDGPRSTSPASGGSPLGSGGAGGNGGSSAAIPAVGIGASTSSGGGGGSMGMFRAYVPMGVTPMITPATTSPVFESSRIVPTR